MQADGAGGLEGHASVGGDVGEMVAEAACYQRAERNAA